MNKFILILFFVIYTFSTAQIHRFVYEVSYKVDSLSNHIEKEDMILDITGEDVQFYEIYAIKTDSINKSMDGFTNYEFPFAKLKRKISSDINSNFYFIDADYFSFETNDKIKWKITSELKDRNKMKLQKATAKFGGRNWEAWFDVSIPFSEGPYKFNGLPGLIVEIKDSRDQFKFDLIKIEKPKKNNPNIVEELFKKDPLKISSEKYNELLIGNYNDPYSRFRSMKPGSWSISKGDNSIPINTIAGLNEITREEQKRIRQDYNPIELDKAVKYKK